MRFSSKITYALFVLATLILFYYLYEDNKARDYIYGNYIYLSTGNSLVLHRAEEDLAKRESILSRERGFQKARSVRCDKLRDDIKKLRIVISDKESYLKKLISLNLEEFHEYENSDGKIVTKDFVNEEIVVSDLFLDESEALLKRLISIYDPLMSKISKRRVDLVAISVKIAEDKSKIDEYRRSVASSGYSKEFDDVFGKKFFDSSPLRYVSYRDDDRDDKGRPVLKVDDGDVSAGFSSDRLFRLRQELRSGSDE